MKRRFTLALSVIVALGMGWDAQHRHANGNASGAPAGNTGSPSDGQTCSRIGCHSGPSQGNQAVSITGNIPQEGYTPGATYDMTVTMSNGGSKFGFSLSPQTPQGTLLGTLIASGAGTQLNGSGKYITHTLQGNSGSGSRSWDFQWTAPVSGTGDVTFYGAYNFADGLGTSGGDVIVTHTHTFVESSSTSVAEAMDRRMEVFPNPADDHINIRLGDVDEVIMVTLMGLDGRVLLQENHPQGNIRIGLHGRVPSGVYLLSVQSGADRSVRRIMVR